MYLPWVLCGRAGGQVAEPHERCPIDPWIRAPRPPAAAGASCQSHVIRDQFRSIQVNVDSRGCNILADAANEPSIAVSLTEPRKMVIGWRQFNSVASDFREPGWAYSHDGGHTWVFRGSLDPGVFGSDPVLAPAPDGQILYVTVNAEDDTRLFRSLDGGMTWPQITQVAPYWYDKPWVAVDITGGVGRGNIYVTSPYSRLFLRSIDGGVSFQAPPVTNGALVGDTVAVGADGTVYVVEGCDSVKFEKSTTVQDSSLAPTVEGAALVLGHGFSTCRGAPSGGLSGQAWVAVDGSSGVTRGNIYILTLGVTDPVQSGNRDPADLVFTSSADGGRRWSRRIVINDDPLSLTSWQWFHTLSVAPNGRIDVTWNDTRDSDQPILSEFFYSYSTDGGQTWSGNTPVSPVFDVQVGFPAGSPKLGDYYHQASDNLGVNVAYAATFNGEQDIYFLRIGPWDCNANEIDDAADISEARSRDCNANDVPDECEYRADVDGDGLTTLSDFTAFRAALTGPTADTAVPHPCFELLDPDHDGDMDLADFYLLEHVFVAP